MFYTYLILILLASIPGGEGWDLSGYGMEIISSFYEGCNSGSIKPDVEGLRMDLDHNLFGQHVVTNNLIASLRNHFNSKPKKPLVIIMNGWTGSGKNYVTEMIIKRMYREGTSSKFVHFFIGRLHFPRTDLSSVAEYRTNLQSWIRGNVTACAKSFFVFDEMDKVPAGIIDGIKPFLDYHSAVDKIDFRESIFVFITNKGGDLILEKYLDLWGKGLPRSRMEYREFEALLRRRLYDSVGVFNGSPIIEDHLISLYLPFLPLEKAHVEKCIEVEFRRKNVKPRPEHVSYILHSLEYYKGIISLSGCKRVADYVGLVAYGGSTDLNDEL